MKECPGPSRTRWMSRPPVVRGGGPSEWGRWSGSGEGMGLALGSQTSPPKPGGGQDVHQAMTKGMEEGRATLERGWKRAEPEW